MRKLRVFENISLNGFFAGAGGDLGWAYANNDSAEFQAFVAGNASTPGTLLFGRVTYEMMASHWPSPQAQQNTPTVAQGMNSAEKLVFSRTLKTLSWNNARLMTAPLPEAVRALKEQTGPDITVLGSGSIVTQLVDAQLLDGLQLVVRPTALGGGTSLFAGLRERLQLRLTGSRAFDDGNLVLDYVVEPVSGKAR